MIQKSLYKFILVFLSNLPYKHGSYLHKFCTYFLKAVVKYRFKVISKNLDNALNLNNKFYKKEIINDVYTYLTAYIFETIQIYGNKKKEFNLEFGDLSEINAITNKQQSVFLLGGHYGNWEWSSMLLPLHTNAPCFAIYKPLSNKILDSLAKEWRARFGLGLLSMNEVVKHLSTFKEPAIYIFIADQRPASADSGRWINFLGRDTNFMEGAEVLSKRYKATVFYQQLYVNKGNYKVNYSLIEDNITQRFAENLERDILENPAPWLWSHNRWKHTNPNNHV